MGWLVDLRLLLVIAIVTLSVAMPNHTAFAATPASPTTATNLSINTSNDLETVTFTPPTQTPDSYSYLVFDDDSNHFQIVPIASGTGWVSFKLQDIFKSHFIIVTHYGTVSYSASIDFTETPDQVRADCEAEASSLALSAAWTCDHRAITLVRTNGNNLTYNRKSDGSWVRVANTPPPNTPAVPGAPYVNNDEGHDGALDCTLGILFCETQSSAQSFALTESVYFGTGTSTVQGFAVSTLGRWQDDLTIAFPTTSQKALQYQLTTRLVGLYANTALPSSGTLAIDCRQRVSETDCAFKQRALTALTVGGAWTTGKIQAAVDLDNNQSYYWLKVYQTWTDQASVGHQLMSSGTHSWACPAKSACGFSSNYADPPGMRAVETSTTCDTSARERMFMISGVQPSTLPSATLQKYNYPPKPASPAYQPAWQQFVDSTTRTAPTCPQGRGQTGHAFTSKPPVGSATNAYSTNWSGNVAQALATEASGFFTVPTAVDTIAGDNAYECAWVGIGPGTSADQPLVQAGSESDITNGQARYYLWTEIVPQQPTQLYATNAGTQPGDTIYVDIRYSVAELVITVSDITLGTGGSYVLDGTFSDPAQAEFINERTGIAGYLYHFPQSDVTFSSSTIGVDSSTYPLGSTSHYASIMTTCDQSAAIDQPLPISSDGLSFSTQWLQYGDSGCPLN